MRKNILLTILDLAFLIVFNIVFFSIIGITTVVATWISYGFIHLSYIIVLLTPFFQKRKIDANLFGVSLLAISFTYFIIQLILNTVLIFTGFSMLLPVLTINVIITGLYIVAIISTILAVDETTKNTIKHEQEIAYIDRIKTKLKLAMSMADDSEILKKLQKEYDILCSSPAKSSQSVSKIELEIEQNTEMIKECLINGNNETANMLLDKTILKLSQRNIMLK